MWSFSGNCAASVQISTFMCLWAIFIFIYSQDRSTYFPTDRSQIGRSIVGIYKSLTDTWKWKLGLRPRNSFSGNICFEFSVLCLCSALTSPWFLCSRVILGERGGEGERKGKGRGEGEGEGGGEGYSDRDVARILARLSRSSQRHFNNSLFCTRNRWTGNKKNKNTWLCSWQSSTKISLLWFQNIKKIS